MLRNVGAREALMSEGKGAVAPTVMSAVLRGGNMLRFSGLLSGNCRYRSSYGSGYVGDGGSGGTEMGGI